MQQLHKTTKHILRRKTTWVVVAVVLLLVAAGVWFAGSMRQTEVFDHANQRYDDVLSATVTIFDKTGLSRGQRLEVVAELAAMEVNSCKADWWNNWQQAVIADVKAAAKKCQARMKRAATVINAARDVNEYLTVDTEVAKQVARLHINPKADKWSEEALESALQANKALGGVQATAKESKGLMSVAKKHLEEIIEAWDALERSSSKQDKTAYLEAEEKLKQSYADLSAITDASDAQVTALLYKLQTAKRTL